MKVMNGNAMTICHMMPYETARNRISISTAMKNEAIYEINRVMTISFQ